MSTLEYPDVPPQLAANAPKHLEEFQKVFSTAVLPEDKLLALRDAIDLCSWVQIPPPKWIADATTQLCYKQITDDRRPGRLGTYKARLRQHRIHLVRWATVRYLRDRKGPSKTWNDAYADASRILRGTIAQGSDEAIAASYKSYSKISIFGSLRKSGGESAVSASAEEYFEARDVLLDMDRLFRV